MIYFVSLFFPPLCLCLTCTQLPLYYCVSYVANTINLSCCLNRQHKQESLRHAVFAPGLLPQHFSIHFMPCESDGYLRTNWQCYWQIDGLFEASAAKKWDAVYSLNLMCNNSFELLTEYCFPPISDDKLNIVFVILAVYFWFWVCGCRTDHGADS